MYTNCFEKKMIIAEYTTNTNIPLDELWSKLVNVSLWQTWDETIEFSELDEPMGEESIGLIKHKDFEATAFMILKYEYMKKIVEVRKSYFGKFKLHREIKRLGAGGAEFIQKIEILNQTAVVFSPFIVNSLKESMVKSIENLEQLCLKEMMCYERA